MKKRLYLSWAQELGETKLLHSTHMYAGPSWSNPRLELARLFCQDRAHDNTGVQRVHSVPQRSLSPHPSHLEAYPVPPFVPCILKNTAAQHAALPSLEPAPATSLPTHLSLLLSLSGRSSETGSCRQGWWRAASASELPASSPHPVLRLGSPIYTKCG